MAKAQPFLKKGETAMRKLIAMASKEENKALIPILRRIVMEKCNELENCPFCSQPIADTKTTFTEETSRKVIEKILQWSDEKGKHEFKAGEIKHLLDHTQYANLNHLVSFGGIIYRPFNRRLNKPYSSIWYGINRQRALEFLRYERKIPIQIRRNRFTKERVDTAEGDRGDLPHVSDLVDSEGKFSQPALT